MHAAELAGHDADAVLEAPVTARSLDDATSPAQVLHHRINGRLTGRLTPHLRDAADDRRHALGTEAAEQAPPWAVAAHVRCRAATTRRS